MTQTLAIFLDAYRELNARKMFWVTLILTVLFVLLFATFAPDGNRMRFLTWSWNEPNAITWYKTNLLEGVLVSVWISWAAVVLAIISTASIFPEFVSGGSIDLYLSKPISRTRLFFTKYAAALLFVVGQATIFSVLAFIVVGIRAGEWKWGLFLTIPLLTLFFSYLYAFCVLMGIWTRSVIASILLTVLFWIAIWGLHSAEKLTLSLYNMSTVAAELYEQRADRAQRDIERGVTTRPSSATSRPYSVYSDQSPQIRRDRAQQQANEEQQRAGSFGRWHNGLFIAKTLLPKTSETIGLMSRELIEEKEIDAMLGERLDHMTMGTEDDEYIVRPISMVKGEIRTQKEIRSRSPAWVIGTSLVFEIVMLFFAARIFARRDY